MSATAASVMVATSRSENSMNGSGPYLPGLFMQELISQRPPSHERVRSQSIQSPSHNSAPTHQERPAGEPGQSDSLGPKQFMPWLVPATSGNVPMDLSNSHKIV